MTTDPNPTLDAMTAQLLRQKREIQLLNRALARAHRRNPKPRKRPIPALANGSAEANSYIHQVLLREAQLRTMLKEAGWLAPEDADALRQSVAEGARHINALLAMVDRMQAKIDELMKYGYSAPPEFDYEAARRHGGTP